jgi:hypothetical protein
MGDYDLPASDNTYIYYTWGDNRDQSTVGGVTRNQPNVRLVRFRWSP